MNIIIATKKQVFNIISLLIYRHKYNINTHVPDTQLKKKPQLHCELQLAPGLEPIVHDA